MITTSLEGISHKEAHNNLQQYGKNVLEEKDSNNVFYLFLKQFLSPFIFVLLGVAFLSLINNEKVDAFVILLILVMNACVGTLQEYKANNAIKALKKLSHSKTKVLREKILHTIKTEDVTINDIVFLESGDLIPADGILIENHMLSVNESQLTGESLPVSKKNDTPLYRGSVVVSGTAFMRVEKIGKETFVGTIAKDIAKNAYKKTELEKKLSSFSFYLLITLGIALIFFLLISLHSGLDIFTAIKTTVALGVAVIPEGLPIVLTVVLSLGALHISRAQALLRNLPSGSTLASVSFICTDKTGTLTYGDLTVKEIVTIDTTGLSEATRKAYLYHSIDLKDINGRKVGDVLDITMDTFLDDVFTYKELKELPFTSETKYNAKEYEIDGSYVQIFKGAPEKLGVPHETIAPYVAQGFRVLAVGYKTTSSQEEFTLNGINPIGLVIFEDKIREEAKQSISECKHTGIGILMITGDNILTAEYVAREVGIMGEETDTSMTGEMLDTLSDTELKEKMHTLKVLARANPIHKERIVKLLQERGEIVAMTGDGVNDGPALSLANIGISMGKSGTEVAREASDLVLLNDNFSDIVLAIFEARTISENIRKTLSFLMTSSVSIVIVILGSLVISVPLPFLAIQILWLNFVTTGLLDVSLATEGPEKAYRHYSYRRYTSFLLNKYDVTRILILGSSIGSMTLLVFSIALTLIPLDQARTAAILLISACIWFNAYNFRKNYDTIFSSTIFGNKFVNFAVILETIILLGSIYSPLGNKLLHTTPLPYALVILLPIIALFVFLTDTLLKIIHTAINKRPHHHSQ